MSTKKDTMEILKDNSKTVENSYGHSDVSQFKTIASKPIYEYINKKTEKIVTALYMVTDCMDYDDAIKHKLRQNGVELLSDIYKLSIPYPVDKHLQVSVSTARIYELLSLIEIGNTIGFVSDMNTNILKREFLALVKEIEVYQPKDKHDSFTINESMLEVPRTSFPETNFSHGVSQSVFNDSLFGKGHLKDKRTSELFKPSSVSFRIPTVRKEANKEDRASKIMSLIKDKKGVRGNETGVSIKDISSGFTDCSEKTIQRDLNSLVSKGQLKKIGAKRWSRYQTV